MSIVTEITRPANTDTVQTVQDIRAAFARQRAALAYDVGMDAAKAAIAKRAAEISPHAPPTPADWLLAASTARCKCGKCAGTGNYVTGTLNGQATGPGGDCFRCQGKGAQNASDGARNRAFDKYAIAREARAMMRS